MTEMKPLRATQRAFPVILLIEHAGTRRRVMELLAKETYNIIPAPDEATARRFAAMSDKGSVILADLKGIAAADCGKDSSEPELPSWKDIPLILLLTQKEHNELSDEIKQQTSYCLVKPVAENSLKALMLAVTTERQQLVDLRKEVKRRSSAIGHIVSGEFEFQTFDEARNLATMLSVACPNTEDAAVGMMELMVNAIEHGNLGIDFEKKSELLQAGNWREEITRRLTLDDYKDRVVRVAFRRREHDIEIRVTDEGRGFDKEKVMAGITDPFRTHGRGIQIAEAQCFDELRYLGAGNVVVGTIHMANSH